MSKKSWLVSASSYSSVLLGKLYPTLRRGYPSRCNLHVATQLTPETISHPDYTLRERGVGGSGGCARHAMSAKARQNRQPSQKNPFDEGNGWGEKVCTAITHRSHLIYLVVPASPSRSFLTPLRFNKIEFWHEFSLEHQIRIYISTKLFSAKNYLVRYFKTYAY